MTVGWITDVSENSLGLPIRTASPLKSPKAITHEGISAPFSSVVNMAGLEIPVICPVFSIMG